MSRLVKRTQIVRVMPNMRLFGPQSRRLVCSSRSPISGRLMGARQLIQAYDKGVRNFRGISLRGSDNVLCIAGYYERARFFEQDPQAVDASGKGVDKSKSPFIVLRDMDLEGADLRGVDFRQIDISGSIITKAIIDIKALDTIECGPFKGLPIEDKIVVWEKGDGEVDKKWRKEEK